MGDWHSLESVPHLLTADQQMHPAASELHPAEGGREGGTKGGGGGGEREGRGREGGRKEQVTRGRNMQYGKTGSATEK